LEKAIEIKRRAQRCIQNGDLDGALSEYEKLVAADDADPYNFVLLADLLFKKGDSHGAQNRYLSAASAYEKTGLYKNGIAVCKKMMRLSLAPALVLERLASLHALDGLGTEASLYYQQYAEHLVRDEKFKEAVEVLRKGFDACRENVKVLERMSEVHLLTEDMVAAASTLVEAAQYYDQAGDTERAGRCRARAEQIKPGSTAGSPGPPSVSAAVAPAQESPATIDALEREQPRTWSETLGAGSLLGSDDLETSGGPPRLPSAIANTNETEHVATPPHSREPVGDLEFETSGPPRLGDIQPIERLETVDRLRPHVPSIDKTPPGLRFDAPLEEIEEEEDEDVESAAEAAPAADESVGGSVLEHVEHLLAEAQQQFNLGDRAAAAVKLVEAAQSYETLGQLDHAASIYRSLCRTPQATAETIALWLANCEQRNDPREGAEVSCELGDRAFQEGGYDQAREWFEKALELDPSNSVAERRLARLDEIAKQGSAAPPPAAPLPAAPPALAGLDESESLNGEQGRVEVAVGRSEAVTFDLGALLSEFQRGIEAQLSGDAQSHYDLGMAYREMGLLEQAVEAFRLASRDPSFQHRSAEMIGRCLLDQGRFEEAAGEFAEVLQSDDLSPELALNMRYQLGLALEAAGHTREALAEFERVFSTQANFSDVALKIRVLRKTLEPA
jgi:tetratricopeptide (TPR) repeat protein